MKKRGVSAIIGYILLVVGAIAMGGIIYNWMSSYVPEEGVKCDDGVSVYVDAEYVDYKLTLTIKNNGRFNIAGVYIKATNDSVSDIATIDLTTFNPDARGVHYLEDSVLGQNLFSPGAEGIFEKTLDEAFEIENDFDRNGPFYIEVVPMMYKAQENKWQTAICGDAGIKQEIVLA
jgi:hypothetical protein